MYRPLYGCVVQTQQGALPPRRIQGDVRVRERLNLQRFAAVQLGGQLNRVPAGCVRGEVAPLVWRDAGHRCEAAGAAEPQEREDVLNTSAALRDP